MDFFIFRTMTFKEYTDFWCNSLAEVYEEREAKNILQLACQDVLGWSRSDLMTFQSEEFRSTDQEALEEILDRLKTGEPYQYCVGFTYFYDLKIEVSPSVLIPRPETEELVEWVREELPQGFNGRIEDWCTGSGCIALALKSVFTDAEVLGIDVSKEAIFRAKSNAQKLGLDVKFEIHSALSDEDAYVEKVDVLVSNPPYIPVHEKEAMNKNVIDFEPELALFVPSDEALLFYIALGQQAQRRLNEGGKLFFELHEEYAHETKAAMESLGFKNVEVRNDLQGKLRMLKASR